jgi:diguanylate cyclase (GGDEF)-like protein
MSLAARARAWPARRNWPMASAPSNLLGYLFAVDAIVLVWVVGALAHAGGVNRHSWGVLLLLVLLALGFEEGASRAARLQLRLSSELKRSMTSVWAVAGAVALPAAAAVLLLGSVLVYTWFRQQRPAGQPLYRIWFNGSTEMLGCLSAGYALREWSPQWAGLQWTLAGAVSVFVAIAIHTTINRGLVTIALLGVGVRGHGLAGSRDENLIELATLCLGGLVAVTAVREPWLCVLVIAPMVTLQRGALVRELETAAMVDSKTGLLNAVAWEQVTKRELARGRRDDHSVAVLIIDIDRFKLVNDRFGHLVGDMVLRHVGRSLEAAVREFDTVGRFGGEEFVVVLPETGETEALVVAERLRRQINDVRVSAVVDGVASDRDEPMSVSIGVACSPVDGAELSDVLMAADGALYSAKARGRNCVVLADHGTGGALENTSRP